MSVIGKTQLKRERLKRDIAVAHLGVNALLASESEKGEKTAIAVRASGADQVLFAAFRFADHWLRPGLPVSDPRDVFNNALRFLKEATGVDLKQLHQWAGLPIPSEDGGSIIIFRAFGTDRHDALRD